MKTILVAKATEQLQKEIDEELNIPDPDDEKSETADDTGTTGSNPEDCR